MKLLMHILKSSPKLGIDNEKASLEQIQKKFMEEAAELIEEIHFLSYENNTGNLRKLISETYDVIQMCILILWRCRSIGKELGNPNIIEEENIKHKDKMHERGWIIETGIEIDIKE